MLAEPVRATPNRTHDSSGRRPGGPIGSLAPPLSTTGEPSSDLATLGIAAQVQLGLKPESARGPIQVLVIDSIFAVHGGLSA